MDNDEERAIREWRAMEVDDDWEVDNDNTALAASGKGGMGCMILQPATLYCAMV